MSCHDIQSRLYDYIDQALSEGQRHRIEAHIKACFECRNALTDMKASLALTQDLDAVDPPHFLATRIMGEIRSTAAKQSWLKKLIFAPVRIPAGVMAAIIVLFSGLSVYTLWLPSQYKNRAPVFGDHTASPPSEGHRHPEHFPGLNGVLTDHALQSMVATQPSPDLQLTMRVPAIEPSAKAVLRQLLEMDGHITGIVADEGEYRITARINTEDKQDLMGFLESIDPDMQVAGGLKLKPGTFVSIALLKQPEKP